MGISWQAWIWLSFCQWPLGFEKESEGVDVILSEIVSDMWKVVTGYYYHIKILLVVVLYRALTHREHNPLIVNFRKRGLLKKLSKAVYRVFERIKIGFEYCRHRNRASKKNAQNLKGYSSVHTTASQISSCCLTTKTSGTGFQKPQKLKRTKFVIKKQVPSLSKLPLIWSPHNHYCSLLPPGLHWLCLLVEPRSQVEALLQRILRNTALAL